MKSKYLKIYVYQKNQDISPIFLFILELRRDPIFDNFDIRWTESTESHIESSISLL